MLDDGTPFAAALGLSHTEQFDRLRAAAPAAVPVATVVGDPCYDRMLASAPYRARYRADLDARDRTLVVISSTWGENSLLGRWPGLIRRLVAESTLDSHRFAVALHPNLWHGHGPGQVRTWLADCVRSGVVLLPEIDGWRSGVLAADVLVGDHGSVTGYGAALGVPTALGTFPAEDVAAGSPIARLGETAPLLSPRGSVLRQLDDVINSHTPERAAHVADVVTSAPGEALPLLRALCYRLLDLPEPAGGIPMPPLTSPPVPEQQRPTTAPAVRVEYALDAPARTVRLTRRPAEMRPEQQRSVEEHDELVCCPWNHPLRAIRMMAAVLTCPHTDIPEGAEAWAHSTLIANPSCRTAAVLTDSTCVLFTRDGRQVHAEASGLPPDGLAAACHAWLAEAGPLPGFPHSITIELRGRRYRAELS